MGKIDFDGAMFWGDHKPGALAQGCSRADDIAGGRRKAIVLTLVFGVGLVSLTAGMVVAEAAAEAAEPMTSTVATPEIATIAAIAPLTGEDPDGETTSETALRQVNLGPAPVRPKARKEAVPRARWSHRPEATLWTRSALAALGDHGQPLVKMVPGDILDWCPAYPQASHDQRAAFWVGFISALTKHESTYKPRAVGGGGLWYGLMQILPSTARLYKCHARSGDALKNGSANLSCAIRIMARTVPRDGVIHAYTKSSKRRWRGVSADWGPMRSAAKRRDMAGWLKAQSYCKPLSSMRPRERPDGLAAKREG